MFRSDSLFEVEACHGLAEIAVANVRVGICAEYDELFSVVCGCYFFCQVLAEGCSWAAVVVDFPERSFLSLTHCESACRTTWAAGCDESYSDAVFACEECRCPSSQFLRILRGLGDSVRCVFED